MQSLGTVDEPGKKVPVVYDVDVAVCGCGVAGSLAAIAAGRQGAKTLVIDRFGQLGGNIGPGGWPGGNVHLALSMDKSSKHEALLNRMGMGGYAAEFHRRVIYARPGAENIPDEVRKELEEKHYNLEEWRMGTAGGMPRVVETMITGHVLLEMMDEVGVETLLSVYIGDPIMDGDQVRGVFVETKSGRLAVRAKVVVDATAEADVAFRSGAPIGNVARPNLGMFFSIGGVNMPRWRQAKQSCVPSGDDLRWIRQTLAPDHKKHLEDPMPAVNHMMPALRNAWESGEYRYFCPVGDRYWVRADLFPRDGKDSIVGGNTGSRGEVDFSDAKQVSLMERAHREQIYGLAQFLRKYVAGFEDSYLLHTAPYLNARGGRYLVGVRPVTGEDLAVERQFDDVIYQKNDRKVGKTVEVPFGAMVPQKIDGLIVSGRGAFVYGPNFRSRASMMMNGQAAGIAAALCARAGIQPRELDVKKLQQILVDLGCPVGEPERLEELGLRPSS